MHTTAWLEATKKAGKLFKDDGLRVPRHFWCFTTTPNLTEFSNMQSLVSSAYLVVCKGAAASETRIITKDELDRLSWMTDPNTKPLPPAAWTEPPHLKLKAKPGPTTAATVVGAAGAAPAAATVAGAASALGHVHANPVGRAPATAGSGADGAVADAPAAPHAEQPGPLAVGATQGEGSGLLERRTALAEGAAAAAVAPLLPLVVEAQGQSPSVVATQGQRDIPLDHYQLEGHGPKQLQTRSRPTTRKAAEEAGQQQLQEGVRAAERPRRCKTIYDVSIARRMV